MLFGIRDKNAIQVALCVKGGQEMSDIERLMMRRCVKDFEFRFKNLNWRALSETTMLWVLKGLL